jgi:hypothetical protein
MDQGNATGSLSAEIVTPASECTARWIAEARRHEQAADRIFGHYDLDVTEMDEEQMLHLEIARVLRNCAREMGALT